MHGDRDQLSGDDNDVGEGKRKGILQETCRT